jgi:hypothetical protein
MKPSKSYKQKFDMILKLISGLNSWRFLKDPKIYWVFSNGSVFKIKTP